MYMTYLMLVILTEYSDWLNKTIMESSDNIKSDKRGFDLSFGFYNYTAFHNPLHLIFFLIIRLMWIVEYIVNTTESWWVLTTPKQLLWTPVNGTRHIHYIGPCLRIKYKRHVGRPNKEWRYETIPLYCTKLLWPLMLTTPHCSVWLIYLGLHTVNIVLGLSRGFITAFGAP